MGGCLPLACFLAGCVNLQPDTPLTAAAGAGRNDEVKTLLAQGADVNAPGGASITPLATAARAGNVETIAILLKAGADPNLRSGFAGWAPVMHAIHKDQERAMLALLEAGADPNRGGANGYTPLMMAAGYGYAQMARDLLDYGADPYAESRDGATALSFAVGGVPDIDRFTLCACQPGVVKALLDRAPNLRLPDNFSGRAALWLARLGRCPEVVGLVEGRKSAKAGA